MKRTTTYGVCPVCHGLGQIQNAMPMTAIIVTCHYCHGNKQVVVSVTEDSHPIEDWKPPVIGNDPNRPQNT